MIQSLQPMGSAGILTTALLVGRKKNRSLFSRGVKTPVQSFADGYSSVLEFGASEDMDRSEGRTIQEVLGDDFLSVGRDIASAFGSVISNHDITVFHEVVSCFIRALNTRDDRSRVFVQEIFDAADATSKGQLLEALDSRELALLKRILTGDSTAPQATAHSDEAQLTFSSVR